MSAGRWALRLGVVAFVGVPIWAVAILAASPTTWRFREFAIYTFFVGAGGLLLCIPSSAIAEDEARHAELG